METYLKMENKKNSLKNFINLNLMGIFCWLEFCQGLKMQFKKNRPTTLKFKVFVHHDSEKTTYGKKHLQIIYLISYEIIYL